MLRAHAPMHACTHACFVHMHPCMHAPMHACMRAPMHACMQVYMHAPSQACTHAPTCMSFSQSARRPDSTEVCLSVQSCHRRTFVFQLALHLQFLHARVIVVHLGFSESPDCSPLRLPFVGNLSRCSCAGPKCQGHDGQSVWANADK